MLALWSRHFTYPNLKLMIRIGIIPLVIGIVEGWSMFGSVWWYRPLAFVGTLMFSIGSTIVATDASNRGLALQCSIATVMSAAAFICGEAAGAAMYPLYWREPSEFLGRFIMQLLYGPGYT